MTRRYRSRLMAAIHETAEGLQQAGVIDRTTLKEFDQACLTPVKPFPPAEIAALREREAASQAVFARYLGVSTGLISQWERGEKKPSGSALKLLSLVEKNGLDFVA